MTTIVRFAPEEKPFLLLNPKKYKETKTWEQVLEYQEKIKTVLGFRTRTIIVWSHGQEKRPSGIKVYLYPPKQGELFNV